jgi:hypothetical protein
VQGWFDTEGRSGQAWPVGALVRGVSAAGAAAGLAYALRLRRLQLQWGSTRSELGQELPGDSILVEADLVATRAIGIHAPVSAVWPWLAQMGQGRGGLYSYDWLENLVGCQMHSADRIVAQWQEIGEGDDFRLHPEVALRVEQVDPPNALVVRGGVPASGSLGEGEAPYDFTWAFVLQPSEADDSRLVVRERYRYLTKWAPLLVEPVAAASFIMTRKMMYGIRDRAEAQPAPIPG